jgi:hypothetical protein
MGRRIDALFATPPAFVCQDGTIRKEVTSARQWRGGGGVLLTCKCSVPRR